jgi:TonB family protein
MMLSEAEYSPRIVNLFRDVRRRALPQTARQLYLLAKADYDINNYESAVSGFKQTLDVIANVEPKEQAGLADLRQLADGFLTLAETRIVKPPPAVAVPMPAPVPLAVAAPPPPVVNQLFTLADVDVTAPVIIDQRLPPWNFRLGAFDRTFKGQLEITIDETGAVEDANVLESVWGPYDAQLLQAARKWRYQPAVKAGKPVRFRRILDINIDPTPKPTR